MRLRKMFLIAAALLSTTAIFAEEEEAKSGGNFFTNLLNNENLELKVVTDFAYYPKSDYVAGSSHFAPITGAYSGLEGRVTGWADYTIKTPLGEHWLLKDANVKVTGGLEISPISVRPMVQAAFTPVPFFVLSAGSSFGFGWNLGPFHGLRLLYQDEVEYKSLTTGKNNFYDVWMQGTLQFDTGSVWKGEKSEWKHILMLASYKAFYQGLTYVADEGVWEWQGTMNQANGWQWAAQGIIAYQMPIIVSTAGIIGDFTGHYSSDDYKNFDGYKGDFTVIDVSPFANFTFGKHDELMALIDFRGRRSFTEAHDKEIEEPWLTQSGSEWYFRRIAFRWTHKF